MDIVKKKNIVHKRRLRIRKKIIGTTARPRLILSCSNRYLFAQVIDDSQHKTLVALSSKTLTIKPQGGMMAAKELGSGIGKLCEKANIKQVVFDRAGKRYHGKVKSFADSCREQGLLF